MTPRAPAKGSDQLELNERQASVLRAVVTGYVGEGSPIASKTISHLLPFALSSAAIRYVLAELAELGLVEKPHSSAGRVPTERGLRLFVAELLAPAVLAPSERRDIAYQVDSAQEDRIVTLASTLLSRHTRQLGFVVAPRLDRIVLRHVSLVKISSERLLVVLVAETGSSYRCTIDDEWNLDQSELDEVSTLLNSRVAGHTLPEVRERLARDAKALRHEAGRLLRRALEVGGRALAAAGDVGIDLVIETRIALLEQPEFADPRRIREVYEAVEAKERLLQMLDRLLEGEGVSVAIGDDLDDPALRHCALVACPYGIAEGEPALGALVVIGPSRMDFSRVIPLVDYLSELVTGKLRA